MADNHSKESRSHNMAQIKGKDTLPEITVRKYLFSKGFRYKINDKSLPGKPDIVLPKYRTVIFVNGCFWHGHSNCKYAKLPQTRTEWWKAKIEKNKERDIKTHGELKKSGWNIISVWTCQLKPKNKANTLENIALLLEKIFLESRKKQKLHPYILPAEIHQVAEREEEYNSGSSAEKR